MSELQAERMVTDEDSIVFNFDLWAYSNRKALYLTYSAYGHLYLVIGFDLAMQGKIRLYLVWYGAIWHDIVGSELAFIHIISQKGTVILGPNRSWYIQIQVHYSPLYVNLAFRDDYIMIPCIKSCMCKQYLMELLC